VITVGLQPNTHLVLVSEWAPSLNPNSIVTATPQIAASHVDVVCSTSGPSWILAFPWDAIGIADPGRRGRSAMWDDRIKRALVSEDFRRRITIDRLPAPHTILRWVINEE